MRVKVQCSLLRQFSWGEIQIFGEARDIYGKSDHAVCTHGYIRFMKDVYEWGLIKHCLEIVSRRNFLRIFVDVFDSVSYNHEFSQGVWKIRFASKSDLFFEMRPFLNASAGCFVNFTNMFNAYRRYAWHNTLRQ